MMGSAVALLALVLPGTALADNTVRSAPDVYTVRMSDISSRRVHVSAEISVRDSILQMRRSVWSSHLRDGWATWVTSVEATVGEQGGESWVPLTYLGDAAWDASRLVGRRVRIRYVVRLEHEEVDWPYGLKESTYVTDDMVHAVGMSLFIFNPSVEAFEVRFEVPRRWRVVAPWDRLDTSARTYSGSGSWQLVHSVLALGSMPVQRTTIGEAEVLIAVSGELARDSAIAGRLLSGVAAEASGAFAAPPRGRFTIVIRQGDGSGGGAFHRGFSMMTRSRLDPEEVAWQRTLAHELIHMWIGANGIETAGPEEEWFKEGFTSYYTALLLARAGTVDRDVFLDELHLLWRMHRGEDGPPLDEAGRDERRWYDHIYGGGAVLAACLDVRLRRGSAGDTSLDDLMAALLARSVAGDSPLSVEAIAAAAGELGGASVASWIRQAVRRPDEIRVEDCWRWLGLEEHGLPWNRRLRATEDHAQDRLDRWLAPREDRREGADHPRPRGS